MFQHIEMPSPARREIIATAATFEEAKELVEAHKTPVDISQMGQKETILATDPPEEPNRPTHLPKQPVNKRERQIEGIKKDIGTCLDIPVLENYAFFLKTYPELQETYDQKLKELTK